MAGTCFLWVLLISSVACSKVKLTKRSTIYIPYSYSGGSAKYALFESPIETFDYDDAGKIVYTAGSSVLHAIRVSDPDNMTVLSYLEYPDLVFRDVAFCKNHVIVVAQNKTNNDDGFLMVVSAHNTTTSKMTEIMRIPVGSGPDMVEPTSDCSKLVVAVEGTPYEKPPNQITDPQGRVVIVSFSNGINSNYNVTSLDFTKFNDQVDDLSKQGVRHVYRENNNPFSNDVEPEYITINADNSIAFVALQENNAIAIVDLRTLSISAIYGLGYKDWSGSRIDTSDTDRGAMMYPYNVKGIYNPDGLAHFTFKGKNYIAVANEGSSKDYEFGSYKWSEEKRGADIDANMLPTDLNSTTKDQLTKENFLGRLIFSVSPASMTGSRLNDLYTFGGRSFSIRSATDMSIVYDSGDEAAGEILANRDTHTLFNGHVGSVDERPFQSYDVRSDDKGSETESITVGEVDGKILIFVSNERSSTIMVYLITDDIRRPMLQDIYTGIPDTRSKTWREMFADRIVSDLDPESTLFLPASKSPTGKPALFVSGSLTGTLSILNVDIPKTPKPPGKPETCAASGMRSGTGLMALFVITVTWLCGRFQH